jgi:hypothetical protein
VRSILIRNSLKTVLKDNNRIFGILKIASERFFKLNEEWKSSFHLRDRLFASDSCHNTDYFSKEITHILVASDETGSGVAAALRGCHFENTTALNFL